MWTRLRHCDSLTPFIRNRQFFGFVVRRRRRPLSKGETTTRLCKAHVSSRGLDYLICSSAELSFSYLRTENGLFLVGHVFVPKKFYVRPLRSLQYLLLWGSPLRSFTIGDDAQNLTPPHLFAPTIVLARLGSTVVRSTFTYVEQLVGTFMAPRRVGDAGL